MFDFDPTMIFEKVEKMSPEECKAFLTGGMFGFGLACAFFEEMEESRKEEKEKERRRSVYDTRYKDPIKQDFRKIRLEFLEREEAMKVLDDLRERLEKSKDGYVTVRDLYCLADLPPNHAMRSWGWRDLEDCEVLRFADRYELRMTPSERIDI